LEIRPSGRREEQYAAREPETVVQGEQEITRNSRNVEKKRWNAELSWLSRQQLRKARKRYTTAPSRPVSAVSFGLRSDWLRKIDIRKRKNVPWRWLL